MDTLITSRDSDRKIMHLIRVTSGPATRMRNQFSLVIPNLKNLKNLSWLHFDSEPRVPERQQVKDHQSCISVSVVYQTIPSSK